MGNDMELKEHSFEYVEMPWDKTSDLLPESDSNCDNISPRWNFIKLQLSRSVSNVDDLVDLIKSYNIMEDADGNRRKPPWKFTALRLYFERLDESERNEFFGVGGIYETICNLALESKEITPKIKLLRSGFRSCVTLHQLQIASLLANAFLCTYPKRDASYPSINFNRLFEGSDTGNNKPFVEKIKCIVHYFRRITEKQPVGNVSFHRLCILDHKLPRWDKTTAALANLQVEIQGKIEDQDGFLQMDFANRFVGGGVLGRGCVQEEIRFIICPELIVARLFTQCLADNEGLFVVGAERYCRYTGFSDKFAFDGDYKDSTPFDDSKHRKTYVIVLDALYFNHSSEQYRESKILRELKKAYVGFKQISKFSSLPLATGNWGCGAFRGDPQLKSILQLMASSQAQRDVLYLTFGDSSLKKQIDDLYALLKERDINVGNLYRIIRLYSRNRSKNQTLFDFIKDTITGCKRRSGLKRSEVADFARNEPSGTRTGCDSRGESRTGDIIDRFRGEEVESHFRNSPDISWRGSEGLESTVEDDSPRVPRGRAKSPDVAEPMQVNADNEVGGLERSESTGTENVNAKPKTPRQLPHPGCSSNEGTTSPPEVTEDVEMMDVPSPSLLSKVEFTNPRNPSCNIYSSKHQRLESEPPSAEEWETKVSGMDFEDSATENASSPGAERRESVDARFHVKCKTRKLIQPKITDCFFKSLNK